MIFQASKKHMAFRVILSMTVSIVTELWRSKTIYKDYKTSKGYEASEPLFQP